MDTQTHGFDPHTHVAEIVTSHPQTAAVFERFGLDYCCGGKVPLKDAAAEIGIDLDEILAQLGETAADSSDDRDWSTVPITELVDDIVERHHGYLRHQLPRATMLAGKVARAHGERDPRLVAARSEVELLVDELRSHMAREEDEAFPACRQVSEGAVEDVDRVSELVAQLVDDHDSTAGHFTQLRKLLDDFSVPDGACTSWRAYLHTLSDIEQDLHRHIHKENHILFPAVMDELYRTVDS